MPKKKTPELDPKEQFKRFEEAAKERGVKTKVAEAAFRAISQDTKTTRDKAKKRG